MAAVLSGFQLHWLGAALFVATYAGGFLVLKYFTGSEAMAISLVLLLTIPLSIGFFFVRPYEEAAWATFYRDITAAPTEPDEAY
jgi:cytochrome b561